MAAPHPEGPLTYPGDRREPDGGIAPVVAGRGRGRLGRAASLAGRVALSIGILGLGLAIFAGLWATRPVLSGSDRLDAGQPVLVFEPRPVPVRRQWSGYGTAQALNDAAVPARVAATVIERPERIRPGASVVAGEMLARLDDSDFRRQSESASSSLAEIEAQLQRLDVEAAAWSERTTLATEDARLAEADLERVRAAAEREAAKVREVEAAQQRVIAAQRQAVATREELDKIPARRAGLHALREAQRSQLRLAQQAIDRCTIVSPIAGVIAEVDVELGESVAPGQRVARIVALDRIEVPLRLPATARADLAVGDDVTLFEEGRGWSDVGRRGAGRTWHATIARLAPDDDPTTRTMTAFAVLDQEADSPAALAPGRFVEGVAVSSHDAPRVVIPRRSVRSDRVSVVRDGRLERREVIPDFTIRASVPELGLPDLDWIVLREALPEGELVVVDGSRSPAEGVKVVPVPVGGAAERVEQAPRGADPAGRPELVR